MKLSVVVRLLGRAAISERPTLLHVVSVYADLPVSNGFVKLKRHWTSDDRGVLRCQFHETVPSLWLVGGRQFHETGWMGGLGKGPCHDRLVPDGFLGEGNVFACGVWSLVLQF